jgi:hypothetical protein
MVYVKTKEEKSSANVMMISPRMNLENVNRKRTFNVRLVTVVAMVHVSCSWGRRFACVRKDMPNLLQDSVNPQVATYVHKWVVVPMVFVRRSVVNMCVCVMMVTLPRMVSVNSNLTRSVKLTVFATTVHVGQ